MREQNDSQNGGIIAKVRLLRTLSSLLAQPQMRSMTVITRTTIPAAPGLTASGTGQAAGQAASGAARDVNTHRPVR